MSPGAQESVKQSSPASPRKAILSASWRWRRSKERVFQHLGVNVNVSVTSLLEHFTVAVECLVRTVAVDTAVLSPLCCEMDLALPGRVGSQAKVHKSLVVASSAARAAAESHLAGVDAASQNIANVLGQDKHIEMRFFA